LSASKSTGFTTLFATDSFDKLSDGEKKQLGAVRLSLSTMTPTAAFHTNLTERSFRCIAPSPFLPFSRTVCNAVAYGEIGMGLVRMNEDGMQRKGGEMEPVMDLGRIWMDVYGKLVSSMLQDMRDGSPDQLRRHLVAMWGKDGIRRWEKREKCEEVFIKSVVELSGRRNPADRAVKEPKKASSEAEERESDDEGSERKLTQKCDRKGSKTSKKSVKKEKSKSESTRSVKFKQQRTVFTREMWSEFLNMYLSACEEAVSNGDLESMRPVPQTVEEIPKERFQHNSVEIAMIGSTVQSVFESHLDECEKFRWKEKQFNNEMARRLRLYYRTPLQQEIKQKEKKPQKRKSGSTLFEMHFEANRFIRMQTHFIYHTTRIHTLIRMYYVYYVC
jgi:hypothetical protein